jgi:hypothetical protein
MIYFLKKNINDYLNEKNHNHVNVIQVKYSLLVFGYMNNSNNPHKVSVIEKSPLSYFYTYNVFTK